MLRGLGSIGMLSPSPLPSPFLLHPALPPLLLLFCVVFTTEDALLCVCARAHVYV